MADAAAAANDSGLAYRIVGALVHQPLLLRAIAWLLRQAPALGSLVHAVGSSSGVAAIGHREHAFSHAVYGPVLAGGEFVIGMESGPRQHADRQLLQQVLPPPERFALATLQALPGLLDGVRPRWRFDLVDDYMVPLAWAGLREAFEPHAAALESQGPFLEALRFLGAQLIIGGTTPADVSARAARSAARVRALVGHALPQIRQAWGQAGPGGCPVAVERNAAGLLWVGHPATVQAGALMMQELLRRPAVYRQLREMARDRGPGAATCAPFRETLRDHVLELLRFRPPFPLLRREVPRDVQFAPAPGVVASASAGSNFLLLNIGALFDPAGLRDAAAEPPARYVPGRRFREPADRYLIFGTGERACIASHQVLEMLVTALAGLLSLPELRWADPWPRRMRYDGPIVTRMRLLRGPP
jgi:cytochrome P450